MFMVFNILFFIYLFVVLQNEMWTAVKVRIGSRKYLAGYYLDLVCVLQWLDNKESGEGKEYSGNIIFIFMNFLYGL